VTHSKSVFSIGLAALIVFALVLVARPVAAKVASLVVDADTGEVFHAVHIDDHNHPASLTKIMTLYLLFDDLESGKVHLTDRIRVSEHAAEQDPSKLGLDAGDTISVEDALLGMVTKSANDAAVAVAEHLGGSESAFAARMTRKARELGMRATQYRNASGLPNPGQISSARDMAILARALLRNHAKEYHYFSTHQFTYNGEVMTNHNHLMEWYPGTDGIKTGFIGASGFNLVASVKRNNRRLIGVVFGGESASGRDRQMARLLDAAFARAPGSARMKMAEDDAADGGADSAARSVMQAMTDSAPPAAAKSAHPHKRAEESAGDADDDGWGIQVGTFSHQAKALAMAKTVYVKLGDVASDGEAAATRAKGRKPAWHARITGLTEDDARGACHKLARSHRPCKVLDLGVDLAAQ
jgi:D-alanyl-D-alanine carboxypeptidase